MDRIFNINEKLKKLKNIQECEILLEKPSDEEILDLKALKDFPPDMLQILTEIGCMKKWSVRNCGLLLWWVPDSISNSMAKDRCIYDVLEINFRNSSNLLFFASDASGQLYFYNTENSPWTIEICDGLGPDPDSKQKYWITYKDDSHPDFLSIIEEFTNFEFEKLERSKGMA